MGYTEAMTQFLTDNELIVRLIAFFSVLLVVAGAEALIPRRALRFSRWVRWPSNITIVFMNSILVRLILPMAPIGFAAYAAEREWGLMPQLGVPDGLAVLLCVVLLDMAIYFQHVMVHAVPVLWRLHRMHHADTDYDVTTGARFHPIEIVLSLGIKLSVIALIGAPMLAVLIFEILLNATAMFNHGNIALPLGLDRVLRLFVVTPDMHRVHHSVLPAETNSNFGFNLPWWDRLFGTYKAQPEAGHEAMTIGLDLFREPDDQRLDRMLVQPFRAEAGEYAVNRRDWDG
ncbi:sterol desaturase family protein [Magnetospira sp. QH-2]|uniref:sterol desaturase family protein n=1 Tax=Magnetospira sp. (strain QH-2) TaxID=1288970 RepID=UPI0003E80A2A|nr:sterol desaturase family protein [Magnetospira sp. QH-2]CCQ75431.1 putative Sterol desaturase-related protein [Magnetospira sp. QH-2]